MSIRAKLDKNGLQKRDKAGRLIWQCDFYEGGKRKRPEIKGSKEYATQAYAELLKKKQPTPSNFTKVKALIPGFPTWFANQDKRPTKKTIDDVSLVFERKLVPFFGEYSICQIDSGLIEQYKKERSQDTRQLNGKSLPIKRRTINKQLSYFSSFLNYCEEEKIQEFNFKVKRYQHRKADKPKPFTMKEIDKMLAVIEPEYQLPFLLMADMGLRRDESLYLKADNVQGKMLYIRGKGSKERVIPITTPRLKEALEQALKQHPNGYLTINTKTRKPYTTIRKALKRAVTLSKINKPIYHHLLRHSFGTNAI